MPDAKYKLVDAVNTSKYSREGREPTWYMARVAEARNAKCRERKGEKNMTCPAGEICRSFPQLIHKAFLGVL